MAMWSDPNCDTCDGGLRPWRHMMPTEPFTETSGLDVGNRFGVLGAGATKRWAGFGQDDDGGDVESPGAEAAMENAPVNIGTENVAASAQGNTNPGETPLNATTLPMANAATGSNSVGGQTPEAADNSGGGGGGGGISSDTSTASTDPTPYIIGGVALAAVGGLAYYMWRRKKARR